MSRIWPSHDELIGALQKDGPARDSEDVTYLYVYLRSLDCLADLSNERLAACAKSCAYCTLEPDTALYRAGDEADCWYVLLSGAVYTHNLFLPPACIGRLTTGDGLRGEDCLVLEPSELIACFHDSDDSRLPSSRDIRSLLGRSAPVRPPGPGRLSGESVSPLMSGGGDGPDGELVGGPDPPDITAGGSRSPEQSLLLEQSAVSEQASVVYKPTVLDVLASEPSQRTEEDIDLLLDFLPNIKVLSAHSLETRRALCRAMRLATVPHARTVLLRDGEELDSWAAIIDGQVELRLADGATTLLNTGDSFGIEPTMERVLQSGEMCTTTPDCKFVCIMQRDYHHILTKGVENTSTLQEINHAIEGLVHETRTTNRSLRSGQSDQIVIRGTPEKLTAQLVEGSSSVDPTYAEDFLLTYRTFISSPLEVTKRLLEWFTNDALRDKVIRVVLLWVNNHYPSDFEPSPPMLQFLESFSSLLHSHAKLGALELLDLARSKRGRPRAVCLAPRAFDGEAGWGFALLPRGGQGGALYVHSVETGSQAEGVGLRRGDQVLEVNGQSWESLSDERIQELLGQVSELSLVVKCALTGYHATLKASKRPDVVPSDEPLPSPRAQIISPRGALISPRGEAGGVGGRPRSPEGGDRKETAAQAAKRRLFGPLMRLNNPLMKGSSIDVQSSAIEAGQVAPEAPNRLTRSSSSDPDLTRSSRAAWTTQERESERLKGESGQVEWAYAGQGLRDYNDNATDQFLKVYRADQSFRYMPVHKEMTTGELVNAALKEFGVQHAPSFYSLWELRMDGVVGVVRQTRVPDSQTNLYDHWTPGVRYYIKHGGRTDPAAGSNSTSVDGLSLSSDALDELRVEGRGGLLQLDAGVVAELLTARDLRLFVSVEAREYIDQLMGRRGEAGEGGCATPNLDRFSELSNGELFWVVTEICSEPNVSERAKLIQHFIKIAKGCREARNLNAMFALVSGLQHRSVERLRMSWERVSNKWTKVYRSLQDLMDLSCNMAKYRSLVSTLIKDSLPMVPFSPLLSRDLTFIHLGNKSEVGGLVNFDKLRLLARELRNVTKMAADLAPNMAANMAAATTWPAFSHAATRHPDAGGLSPLWAGSTHAITSGFATLRRRKTDFYEEALMVRRVKHYLASMPVITDEAQLALMSADCEPNSVIGQARRRDPSPMPPPPSAFSNDPGAGGLGVGQGVTERDNKPVQMLSTGPKFGTESPQAVRKLMALSEKVKPHDQRKKPVPPGNGLPSDARRSAPQQAPPPAAPPTQRGGSKMAVSGANPVSLSVESSSVIGGHFSSPRPANGSMGMGVVGNGAVLRLAETSAGHGSSSTGSKLKSNRKKKPDRRLEPARIQTDRLAPAPLPSATLPVTGPGLDAPLSDARGPSSPGSPPGSNRTVSPPGWGYSSNSTGSSQSLRSQDDPLIQSAFMRRGANMGDPPSINLSASHPAPRRAITPLPDYTTATQHRLIHPSYPRNIHAPESSFHSLQTSFHSPRSSNHLLQSSFHSPQSSFHAPQSSFHAPGSSFHATQSSYHAAQSSLHPPQSQVARSLHTRAYSYDERDISQSYPTYSRHSHNHDGPSDESYEGEEEEEEEYFVSAV